MAGERVDGCLFCGIIAREVPGQIVFEDELSLAFRDIAPVAPIHLLVVPKHHVADILEVSGSPDYAAGLIAGIAGAAAAEGITQFRTVFNTGAQAGQSVFHVHAHLLAGRQFGWPPD